MRDHSYAYLEDKGQNWSPELTRDRGQDSIQVPKPQSPGPRECAAGPPCLSREDSRAVITLSIFPRDQYECHKPSWSSAGRKTELSTGYLRRGRRAAGKQPRSRHALSTIQFLTQSLALRDTQCVRPEHIWQSHAQDDGLRLPCHCFPSFR